MTYLSNALIGLIAFEHLYFLVLEMYLWAKPWGLKTFGHSLEQAESSAILAANQGLYNGFLAVGLVWALFQPELNFSYQLKIFFLGCVILAGAYGGYSVGIKIFFLQALPAIFTLALLVFMRMQNS